MQFDGVLGTLQKICSVYILSAQDIRQWDQYTIEREPVSSIVLMERAAGKCVDWILAKDWRNRSFKIFCSKGNNGGDGLAIARLLLQDGFSVSVYILEFGKPGATDFQINLHRLKDTRHVDLHFITAKENFPLINTDDILIDALFGSGLNKPLDNLAAEIVEHINHSKALVISIDLPSGLFPDQTSKGNKVVKANYTLTCQCYKRGLLVQDNAMFIGEVHVLDIGLDPLFLHTKTFTHHLIDVHLAKQAFQPRNLFAHKGQFGHALITAGSYGKIGAAVIAAKACLKSGVGLLTCYLPKCGYAIMQASLPEAMVITDDNENELEQLPGDIEKYSVIGIGPGIGTTDATKKLVSFIIRRYKKPLVIDADGLNCLSLQKELLDQLPPYSVLTPHVKEFDRLFGEHQDDFERIHTANEKAKKLNIIIVLKSHHTLIATPSGNLYFNSTGNPGMAKGGTGDALTGIITSLLAQNYSPEHAAILGVYLHGLAGDLAANALSQEAMMASDLISFLSHAFKELK